MDKRKIIKIIGSGYTQIMTSQLVKQNVFFAIKFQNINQGKRGLQPENK